MAPQCFSLLQELATAGSLTAASLLTARGPHEAASGASPLLSAIKSMLLSRSARRQEACVLLSRLMAHGPTACFPQLVELEVCEHLYELLRGAAGVQCVDSLRQRRQSLPALEYTSHWLNRTLASPMDSSSILLAWSPDRA